MKVEDRKKFEGFYRNGVENGKWTTWIVPYLENGQIKKGRKLQRWKYLMVNGLGIIKVDR